MGINIKAMLGGLCAGVLALGGTAAAEPWSESDEVRAVVAEMLADAEGRSSLLQSGGTAGHDGGFFIGLGRYRRPKLLGNDRLLASCRLSRFGSRDSNSPRTSSGPLPRSSRSSAFSPQAGLCQCWVQKAPTPARA